MLKTYKIIGMTCSACAQKIMQSLKNNFESVSVSLEGKSLNLSGKEASDLQKINSLVKSGAGEKYSVVIEDKIENLESAVRFGTFWPLILTVSMISLGTLFISFRVNEFGLHELMLNFMGLFFIFFSFFKLLDIAKFAQGYASYDLIAKKWYNWGYIYPLIEFMLGVLYLLKYELFYINLITGILMTIGTISVIRALLRKSKIQCACLGGLFNLPMTKVTLFEDLLMALMAFYMMI
jgi:copper chaperone CopZ